VGFEGTFGECGFVQSGAKAVQLLSVRKSESAGAR